MNLKLLLIGVGLIVCSWLLHMILWIGWFNPIYALMETAGFLCVIVSLFGTIKKADRHLGDSRKDWVRRLYDSLPTFSWRRSRSYGVGSARRRIVTLGILIVAVIFLFFLLVVLLSSGAITAH